MSCGNDRLWRLSWPTGNLGAANRENGDFCFFGQSTSASAGGRCRLCLLFVFFTGEATSRSMSHVLPIGAHHIVLQLRRRRRLCGCWSLVVRIARYRRHPRKSLTKTLFFLHFGLQLHNKILDVICRGESHGQRCFAIFFLRQGK